MSFKIEGNDKSGAGRGSFAMAQKELVAEFSKFLDDLRAGEYRGDQFTVIWDQADEPHVAERDKSITDERICRICQDYMDADIHIQDRRITGSRK